jgi:non-specific serine/threonine protein kinase/serine/threonine-protein kinase
MSPATDTGRLTPARRRLIDRLLDSLLDLEATERSARLDALRRRAPRIHDHVRRLLAASLEPTSFLSDAVGRAGSAAFSDLDESDPTLPPGTRIGDWRLVAPAGAGGMGRVYRAERADGTFEMPAAIKFIRTRNDARLAERLTLETRLLARLDHPNIARVLDGGTLPDGRNYLVMEWIEGDDLAQCRADWSDASDRCLGLFAEIAEAVEHAHQRRVVHGDIKPANIRVAADGRPRLVDFGVARMLSDEGDALARGSGLTPAFSAPELRAGQPASTQSDIFALGALLRWLLTGEPGSDGSPMPTGRIGFRHPRALAAIVDKAMATDPQQRYRAVAELIRDVRAVRESRPVSARRYGAAARLGLWARRHRAAAVLAGLAVVAVLTGVVGISWQARIAAAERDAARFEAERSTLLREQLVLLFREVGRDAPEEGLSTRELLVESARMAERLHANDPQMLASIKALLGEIRIAMNDFAGAEPLLQAFIDHKPNLASPLMQAIVRADLAQIRLRQGRSEEALALTATALDTLQRAPGRNAARIADVMQIRGQALRGLGRWDESIATLREALKLARSEPRPSRLRATTRNNLATTLVYAGRTDEALPHLRAALDNWRAMGLADGSSALTVMGNLASLLHQRGLLDQAEPLYREAIRRRTERFGESGALAAAHLNLGALLATRYRARPAREHIARGLEMITRFEGRDSISHVRGRMSRGRAELALGNAARAEDDLRAARSRFAEVVGPEHLFTAIAEFYAALARAETEGRVTPRLARAADGLAQHRPASLRHYAHALCAQARLAVEDDPATAAALARECLDIRRDRLKASEWLIADARSVMLAAQLRAGDASVAQSLREARSVLVRELGDDHPKTAWCDRWLRG